MAEAKINIPAKPVGILIAIGMAVFFAMQVVSPSENTDPKLKEKIVEQLSYKLSDYNMNMIAEMRESENYDNIDTLLENSNRDNIEIHSLKTSKPPFSWGSSQKYIVKVEFSLPKAFDGGERHTEYYRATYSALTSHWTDVYKSSGVSFYLNFF